MKENDVYDLTIIGGGVAGLTLANLMAEKGYSVILLEKDSYPVQKVCGEYLSMEVWDFLIRLGLDLESINPPRIRNLRMSSPSGKYFEHHLDPGGFGLSRYFLDHALADLAKKKGATIVENSKAAKIGEQNFIYEIATQDGQTIQSRLVIGAYGKRSQLDRVLNRKFISNRPEVNYVGVKYHVNADLPDNRIELHIFDGGYCGISKVENDLYCLCYLVDSRHLKEHKNIEKLEHEVLMQNPFLKQYFNYPKVASATTLSQLVFGLKSSVEDHILYLGDSAGFIAPLTGNGMSMAIRTAYVLSMLLDRFFKSGNRKELEIQYQDEWTKLFKSRISRSLILQRLMIDSPFVARNTISALRIMPFLIKPLVKMTHGERF